MKRHILRNRHRFRQGGRGKRPSPRPLIVVGRMNGRRHQRQSVFVRYRALRLPRIETVEGSRVSSTPRGDVSRSTFQSWSEARAGRVRPDETLRARGNSEMASGPLGTEAKG